ncbi:unnamed protein product [Rotaria sp. Silwood1]|nr:unnamed protein product [Rotaria sp. Silwood1]
MTKNKEIDTNNETSRVKYPLVCSHRLILAVLAFFGFFLCYAQRNGLSVSIVCMVDPDVDNITATHSSNSITAQRYTPARTRNRTTIDG